MKNIVDNNIDSIRALCKQYNVKSLFIFGSVCTDKFREESDVDFLVAFHPMDYGDYADNYLNLAMALEKLLTRPVDLITDKSLSNPFFIDSVNKTKQLIYAA